MSLTGTGKINIIANRFYVDKFNVVGDASGGYVRLSVPLPVHFMPETLFLYAEVGGAAAVNVLFAFSDDNAQPKIGLFEGALLAEAGLSQLSCSTHFDKLRYIHPNDHKNLTLDAWFDVNTADVAHSFSAMGSIIDIEVYDARHIGT